MGDAFRFEEIDSQNLEIDGVPVRVATPQMLYRMKRDTVRMRDRTDAERLKKHYDIGED